MGKSAAEATSAGIVMSCQCVPLGAMRRGRGRWLGLSNPVGLGRSAILAPVFATTARFATMGLFAIALALGATVGSAGARAQASGEVLLGTFDTRREDATGRQAAPPATGFQAPGTHSRRNQEMDAHRLLQDAREDLSAGYVEAARGRLQDIVRRYPDTTAARDAGAILDRIEGAGSRDRGLANADRSRPGDRPPEPRGNQDRERREAGGQASTPRDTRQTEDSRRARLSTELRMTAGDRVFFANGSAELGARARQVLAAQAAWIVRHPGVVVVVEGHGDDAGAADANRAISQQRAEAVRQRLVEEGAPAERVRISAHGRERPVAACADPACTAQNRRAVTVVADTGLANSEQERGQRYGFGPRR